MAKRKKGGGASKKIKSKRAAARGPAKKAPVKKTSVKKAPVKKAPAKRPATRKAPARKVAKRPPPRRPASTAASIAPTPPDRPSATRAVIKKPGLTSPIPTAWLADEDGRELALDSLAAWVVSTLQAAPDDASVSETLKVAIKTFYDIREAANQPRGEYAGHFFIVDAVGLAESNRPVPWQVLAETVTQERLDRFSVLFEEAVRDVS